MSTSVSPDLANPPSPPRRAWALVAQREVIVKLTDKAFVLGTLAMLVLLAAVLAVQAVLADRTEEFTVAATPQTVAIAEAAAGPTSDIDENVVVDVRRAADPAAARTLVRDEAADAWLAPTDDGFRLVGLRAVDGGLEAAFGQSVQQQVLAANAAAGGVDLAGLEAGSTVTTGQLEGDATRSQLADLLGFGMAFLFYISSLLFGIALANSVVEEKQSRLVEILASTISVRQLLAGKIVGSTVLALGQLLLIGAVSVVGLSFTEFSSALPAVTGGIGWFAVFFLVGFLLVSTLYAVAGALASRTEDVQSTSGPATIVVFVVFFGGAFLSGTAEVVASFLPPTSALIMPIRVVSGEAAWWEPVVALVLLVLATAAVLVAASRLYRRALLQTSGKLSMRQAWTAAT
ncbi:ABC transporter permease [Nocardioidaceae bacterium]|nr:ABC transporter permease [Nocardioidaceae bacterium]